MSPPSSIPKILSLASRVYLQNWLVLSRPLFLPILLQLAGFYLPFSASIWILGNATQASPTNQLMMLGLYLIISIGSIILFLKGFWQFLVCFVALNPSFQSLLDQKELSAQDIKESYQKVVQTQKKVYRFYLLMTMGVQLPGLFLGVVFSLPLFLLLMVNPSLENLINILSTLLIAVITYTLYAWVSFGFQLLAFSETPISATQLIKESFQLVKGNFWPCFSLLLITFIVCGFVVPEALYTLLKLSGALYPLDTLHAWLLSAIMDNYRQNAAVSFPELLEVLNEFTTKLPAFAQAWSKGFIYMVVSILILPWGTGVHLLLFRHLQAKARQSN